METINVKIIIDKQTNKFVEVTIDKNAKLRDLLSEASKSENMKDISYFKLAIPDGDLVGPESLDKTINELEFTDKSCECWISPYTLDNNKKGEDKWKDWIDLKSISLSQDKKNEDAEKNEDDSITLIISNYFEEVTRLNVTKNTTMKEIKEQLQKKYNLSDERINELYLSYDSANILCNLNATVEQVFDKKDIKNRTVKACALSFDFNLKTSEKEIDIANKLEYDNKNDRNKNGIKVNWKLIILIILGLLFFIGAVLAWYLEASCFLIGALVVAGVVFFSLSFVWPKLKSCIGCIKIGVLKRTEEHRDYLSHSKLKLPVVNNDKSYRDEQKVSFSNNCRAIE